MINEKDEAKTGDDYQFNDDDLMGSDFSPSKNESESQYNPTLDKPASAVGLNSTTHRNAIIIIAIIFFLYLIYRMVVWFNYKDVTIPKKTQTAELTVPKPPISNVPREKLIPASPPPIQPVAQPVAQPAPPSPELENKMNTILSDQSKMQSDLQSVMSNESSMQTNIQALSAKIDELTKMIGTLNTQLTTQADEIKKIEMRRVAPPKIRHAVVHKRSAIKMERLYLQAVIPGRAWLIKKNGTDTITVREGTRVPGYGVVQLIDPSQGRVVMSSGVVITFGQWDS